jgi:hypothetical protein
MQYVGPDTINDQRKIYPKAGKKQAECGVKLVAGPYPNPSK